MKISFLFALLCFVHGPCQLNSIETEMAAFITPLFCAFHALLFVSARLPYFNSTVVLFWGALSDTFTMFSIHVTTHYCIVIVSMSFFLLRAFRLNSSEAIFFTAREKPFIQTTNIYFFIFLSMKCNIDI